MGESRTTSGHGVRGLTPRESQEPLSARAGVYRCTNRGRILFMDEGALRVFGLLDYLDTPGGVIGRDLADLVTFLTPAPLSINKLKAPPCIQSVEALIQTPGGEKKWISQDYCRIQDSRTKEGVLQVVVHDTTAQREAEGALRESEQLLRLAENAAHIGTWEWVFPDGCLHLSPEVKHLFSGTRAPTIQSTHAYLAQVHPEDRGEVEKVFDEILNIEDERTCWHLEHRFLHRDGHVYRLDIHMQATRHESDGSIRLIGTVADASRRERAEGLSTHFSAHLQQIQRIESLGVLARGIAHDFNNLLMGIMGHADLGAQESGPESPISKHLTEIEDAARRAAEMCNQMLAYSGKIQPAAGPVNLSDLVDEMKGLLSITASKRIQLHYGLAPDLPPTEGNPAQLSQLIMNLVTNAAEAIGRGEGHVFIATGIQDCDRDYFAEACTALDLSPGTYLFVEIRDTGCGVESDSLPRLFEPFYTTKQEGRGLGLSAARHIAREHGGDIRVRTTAGKGSAFAFLLPVPEQAGPSAPEPSEPNGEPLPPNQMDEAPLAGGTILVVDDEEPVRNLAAKMLRYKGYDVLMACDGVEAVKVYREHADEILLVLLDMTMPRLPGVEAMHAIRETDPDAVVLLTSGYNEEESLHHIMGPPPAGFLKKPYKASNLMDKVHEALQ